MKVAFRADASIDIGSGHVMRCLTLADALRDRGDETLFLCREFPGHLCETIAARGHSVRRLPAPKASDANRTAAETADWLGVGWLRDATESKAALAAWGDPEWLVVDHYGIDARWEGILRAHRRRIMVIDDLANRVHDCDLLLDQNLQSGPDRYASLVPDNCRRTIGPRFALLRPEYAALRATLPARTGQLRRLLVFLGGGDPDNFTSVVLQALGDSALCDRLSLDVVIGAANPHRQAVARLCSELPSARLHIQTSEMAELMAAADMMIGAAGSTTWERCCLGLPAILVSLASNQRENGRQVAACRAAVYLGDSTDTDGVKLAAMVSKLASRPSFVRRLGKRASDVTEGCGANFLAMLIHGNNILLRRAREGDCERVWRWRNDPRTRHTAFDPSPIDLAAHRHWYKRVLENPNQTLLLGAILGRDVGVLRYDAVEGTAEVSVYLDPELHGLGLGATLIAAGSRWIENEALPVTIVIARIRPENKASLKAFGDAGFRHDSADPTTLLWRRDQGSGSATQVN